MPNDGGTYTSNAEGPSTRTICRSANAEQPYDQGHSCSRQTQNSVKASVKAPTTAFAASLVRGATSRGGGAVMCKGVGKQRFYRGLEADVIFRPQNKTKLPT